MATCNFIKVEKTPHISEGGTFQEQDQKLSYAAGGKPENQARSYSLELLTYYCIHYSFTIFLSYKVLNKAGVSNLHKEIKRCRFKTGCWLCPEVGSLQ